MRSSLIGLMLWVTGVAGVVACSSAGGSGPTPGGEPGTTGGTAGTGGDLGGAGGGSSGAGGLVLTGGNNNAGGAELCQAQEIPGSRVPASVLVVLDRSGSMDEGNKWQGATGAISTMLTNADPELGMGLLRFPENTPAGCPPPVLGDFKSFCDNLNCMSAHECVDIATQPQVAVGPLKQTANQIQDVIAVTSPNGGTPTVGALRSAYEYMGKLQVPGERYVLLITDGVPSFATPGGGGGACIPEQKDCGTKADLGKLTSDARNANPTVRTFVIGAPGSEDGLEILSGLALNGGTCRPGGSHSNYSCHYQIGTSNFQQELAKVLTEIAGTVSNCTYSVPKPDSGEVDPGLVNVVVKTAEGESTVPKDDAQQDGWNYTDDSKTKIQIFGPTCDSINQGLEATVTIGLGCQTIVR